VSNGDDRDHDVSSECVRRVRLGHGANCSSIGSVVDTLFATATVGAAVFAVVVAALAKEPVKVTRRQREPGRGEQGGGPP
jgi:hypothetical protein